MGLREIVTAGALLLGAALPADAAKIDASVSHLPGAVYYNIKVEPGDSLSSIADQVNRMSITYFAGDVIWAQLASYNQIRNPYVIHPGQQLRLMVPQVRLTPDQKRYSMINYYGAFLF